MSTFRSIDDLIDEGLTRLPAWIHRYHRGYEQEEYMEKI